MTVAAEVKETYAKQHNRKAPPFNEAKALGRGSPRI